MITWENYEEYMMMYADRELRPDEEQELMAFVSKHPELKKELATYELTRLIPDNTQLFADKDSLLKQEAVKRTIAFPLWRKYSIAAGIAAVIFISLFKYVSRENGNNEVAKTDTAKTHITETVAPPVVAKNTTEVHISEPTATKDTVAKAPRANISAPAVARVTRKADQKASLKDPGTVVDNSHDHPVAPGTINKLQVADAKEMPYRIDKMKDLVKMDTPVYVMQDNSNEDEETDKDKKTFLDKLPIAESQKKQLEAVAEFVSDAYEKVSTTKQTIKDKSLTVRIQKGRLLVSF